MAEDETPKADAAAETPETAVPAEASTKEVPAPTPSDEAAAPSELVDAPAAEGDAAPAEGEAAPTAEGEKAPEKKRDIFAELLGEAEEQVKIHKAKSNKNVQVGLVHVTATFNNTIVSVTDLKGNTIGWSSAGKMGFKGSRKSTAYAAQVVSQDACRQAMSHGLKEVEVRVKGPGAGRESAVRAVQGLGIEISDINDVTPIPHNGCRPKKARRV